MKLNSHLELQLAKLVSWVFSPVIVTILAAFLVVSQSDLSNFFAACVFLLVGGFFPVAADVYEYLRHRNATLEPAYQQRNEIYLIALFSFSISSLIFGSAILTSTFWMNLAMVMAIFFALYYMANKYFAKASLHVGMFCVMAMLLIQHLSLTYALLFTIFPIVVWSRIRLHRHTWAQILVGTAIGMSVGLLTWLI